jgi:hypothetical protein
LIRVAESSEGLKKSAIETTKKTSSEGLKKNSSVELN